MKVSEMNGNQYMVYQLAIENCSDYIGGFENQMQDSCEGSDEYNEAKRALSLSHDELVEEIASWCRMDNRWRKVENLHLVGLDFLKERISKRLTKWGY